MAKYLIAGGSGLIGRTLTSYLLAEGHEVSILSTKSNPVVQNENVQTLYWNPAKGIIDIPEGFGKCRLINLAGAGVADKRWTAARKKEIVDSRIQSLETLYKAVETGQLQVEKFVTASAIGYYGRGAKIQEENDPPDRGFLPDTCRTWEKTAKTFKTLNVPLAIVRIGIVMSKEGGALPEFLKPMRFGIAGIPSNGRQFYSWIHIEDVARIFMHLAEQPLEGIYNAVSPNPCMVNTIFKHLIAYSRGFYLRVHAPEWLLKIIVGEMSVEVLQSTIVSSRKIESTGYTFRYPTIESCIAAILRVS
jgi:uncharacterized protein (TIGR01777 family)